MKSTVALPPRRLPLPGRAQQALQPLLRLQKRHEPERTHQCGPLRLEAADFGTPGLVFRHPSYRPALVPLLEVVSGETLRARSPLALSWRGQHSLHPKFQEKNRSSARSASEARVARLHQGRVSSLMPSLSALVCHYQNERPTLCVPPAAHSVDFSAWEAGGPASRSTTPSRNLHRLTQRCSAWAAPAPRGLREQPPH